MGAIMGIFEDALTHRPIGINGIAKTVVGFLAASVGVRIAVENQTIRLLLNFPAFVAFKRHRCLYLSFSSRPRLSMAVVY